MEIVTVWFLVQLFAATGGGSDYWTLRPGNMPIEFKTQVQCTQAGMDLMIDRRNTQTKLICIEADDEQDLHDIMLRNFRFKGDAI